MIQIFPCIELPLFAVALSKVFALLYGVGHVETREQSIELHSPSHPLAGKARVCEEASKDHTANSWTSLLNLTSQYLTALHTNT